MNNVLPHEPGIVVIGAGEAGLRSALTLCNRGYEGSYHGSRRGTSCALRATAPVEGVVARRGGGPACDLRRRGCRGQGRAFAFGRRGGRGRQDCPECRLIGRAVTGLLATANRDWRTGKAARRRGRSLGDNIAPARRRNPPARQPCPLQDVAGGTAS